ncbi:MAG: hypothetical protein RL571_1870 [Pseudomonadota bacterium]|jgi:hypothetical protein
MMSKNDVKGVVLAAIAGVVAMMIYDKIKKRPNLAPRKAQSAPPDRMGWIKEVNGPLTWDV